MRGVGRRGVWAMRTAERGVPRSASPHVLGRLASSHTCLLHVFKLGLYVGEKSGI